MREITIIKCKICSNTVNNRSYKVREMMFGLDDEFTYVECSKCGCLQISEIPQDISRYYPPRYFSFSKIKPELSTYSMKSKLKSYFNNKRYEYALFGKGRIGKFLYNKYPLEYLQARSVVSEINLTSNSSILDVGCGSGDLLYGLRQIGFKNLLGIDKYIETDIQYENGLRILKKEIQEVNGKWDLIMFHHSFEHMPNQIKTLQKVSQLLSKNKICLISMPTTSSYAWAHYKTNWVQLDAPRHLFIHSIESLKLISEQVGLKLKEVFYNSTAFQFWGSEQYVRGIPLCSNQSYNQNQSNAIFSSAQIQEFDRKARELNIRNEGDMAEFYLIKSS
jgi:2-polyprenyl-3-methyl-5-hydroxy-6-metoxy-1,4-benzoquinol methylase